MGSNWQKVGNQGGCVVMCLEKPSLQEASQLHVSPLLALHRSPKTHCRRDFHSTQTSSTSRSSSSCCSISTSAIVWKTQISSSFQPSSQQSWIHTSGNTNLALLPTLGGTWCVLTTRMRFLLVSSHDCRCKPTVLSDRRKFCCLMEVLWLMPVRTNA